MAKFAIEILDGDRSGEVVALGERPLRIGRKPVNDLVLADEKASGVHAEIAFEGERHVLRDLGSTNGTFMDGRKVTEVVLGPGDTFTIGRVRMRFAVEGAAGAVPVADSQAPAVGRIDAARLQAARSGSRSVVLLAVLLVLVLVGGGFVYWRTTDSGAAATEGANGPRPELRVPGNLLPQEVASCEGDTGWSLGHAGLGFRAGGAAHTGQAGLEALRGAPADGAAAAAVDFAVAATAVELKVLAGRPVTAQAHLRTTGSSRAAVRVAFTSSSESNPFRFCTGTALASYADWERAAVTAVVPVGCDRCRIEVVALVPDGTSSVQVDDIALLEGGEAAALEHKIGEVATVIGCGQSVAVRSMDPDAPAVLLGLAPAQVEPAASNLRAAGHLELSDLAISVRTTVDERAASFAVQGAEALDLAFPAESAGGLLGLSEQGFAAVDAAVGFTATGVLLGDRSARCLLLLPAAMPMRGTVQGGVFRLSLPTASFQLAVGFRQERLAARDLLRRAEESAQQGQVGHALDQVRELLRTVPHDAETLGQAVQRRGEWQELLAARLRQLALDLEEAEFFLTRGGFERVRSGLDELATVFGARNFADPTAVEAMRGRSQERLLELDRQRAADQHKRLQALAAALAEASQTGLAALVRAHLEPTTGQDGSNGGKD